MRGYDETHMRSQFYFNNPICPIIWVMKNMPSMHIEIPFIDVSGDEDYEDHSVTKLGKYFLLDMKAFAGHEVSDVLLSQYSGKVWNYMLECTDPNFYEMYVDTVTVTGANGKEVRPCLFHRPKPFDRSTDTVIKIKNAEIKESPQGKNFSTSEAEQEEEFSLEKGGNKIKQNLVTYNKVIYPDIKRGDIVFTTASTKFIEQKIITTYVAIADMDDKGQFKLDSPRFKGERDPNNPDDPNNKSMVIPWTWDGDTYFKTMITGEKFHVITEDMIIEESMGFSDYEVMNYITFTARKDLMYDTLEAQFGYLYPLVDAYSIQKFGLRSAHFESNLISEAKLPPEKIGNDKYSTEKPSDKSLFGISEYLNQRERLFNWNRYNPILESGSIVTNGNQDYRIGDKVYFPDAVSKKGYKGMYAYIVGVRNKAVGNIKQGFYYTNTLELIRAENPKELQEYAMQINKETTQPKHKVDLNGNQTQNNEDNKVIKLGTTYFNYDEVYGAPYNASTKAQILDPHAHNILKFDRAFATEKIGASGKEIRDIQTFKGNEKNENVKKDTKIYSGVIHTVSQTEYYHILKKYSNIDLGGFDGDFKRGGKTNVNGFTRINIGIYQLLEFLASKFLDAKFPEKLQVLSLIRDKRAHGRGNAIDLTFPGYDTGSVTGHGKPEYIEAATLIGATLLNKPQAPGLPVLAIHGKTEFEKLKGSIPYSRVLNGVLHSATPQEKQKYGVSGYEADDYYFLNANPRSKQPGMTCTLGESHQNHIHIQWD